MTNSVRRPGLEPFFLPAQYGDRFCNFYPAVGATRGGVVYLHPFAEEMNKARRMAAVQSRALAAAGYGVLQIDLLGCGDSSGDFGDASWEAWQQDVALAVSWLSERTGGKIILWGLRLGALLALDAARFCDPVPARFLLWQPVLSGEQFMNQFLRLRLASEMLSDGKATSGLQELRAALAGGEEMEVAGYRFSPQLIASIDQLKLSSFAAAGRAVHWLEVTPEAGRDLPPAARRVADAWTRDGMPPSVQCVSGPPFWSTVETAECPALLDATTRIMAELPQ